MKNANKMKLYLADRIQQLEQEMGNPDLPAMSKIIKMARLKEAILLYEEIHDNPAKEVVSPLRLVR